MRPSPSGAHSSGNANVEILSLERFIRNMAYPTFSCNSLARAHAIPKKVGVTAREKAEVFFINLSSPITQIMYHD